MSHINLEDLLEKFRSGTCTEAEKALLESWYIQHEGTFDLTEPELEADLKSLSAGLPLFRPVVKPLKKRKTNYVAAGIAAMLLLVLSAGLLLVNNKLGHLTNTKVEILPGGNKAVLILKDGSRISLTDAADGNIASQGNVRISKTKEGQLIYTIISDDNPNGPVDYNTIETPKGGQFQVILPDGTKVWLNAVSSLRYPTRFGGAQRKVVLNGEGYFEVTKNKNQPFVVATAAQEVEVLGTQFNLNTYADESVVKTTLIEGSVKVKIADGFKILKPGEQSVLYGKQLTVNSVDTDVPTAWKNGQFMFNDENIESIMRQISRWYNVDVEYRGKPSDSKLFWGTISRFENVAEVLDILELTKAVKFKIEGRRIIVMR